MSTNNISSQNTITVEHSEGHPIVLDIGSGITKAGFAGETNPKEMFPSTVRVEYQVSIVQASSHKKEPSRDTPLSCLHPVERGLNTHWEEMEQLLKDSFYSKLRIHPNGHSVLLSEPPLNPRSIREKITSIMFELFDIDSLFLADQAVLAMCAAARSTGIVLESGDGVTHAVSIVDHKVQHQSVLRLDFGGRDLSQMLARTLSRRIPAEISWKPAQDIKENISYVPMDYLEELSSIELEPYELPDGHVMSIGKEKILSGQALFDPSLLGIESFGIHEIMFQSVMSCDHELRKNLLGNVVLSGGSTMFPQLPDRLYKELRTLSPSSMKINILEPTPTASVPMNKVPFPATPKMEDKTIRGKYVWLGGSVVASLSSFGDMCITKEQYEEVGPSVIHQIRF